jgi:glutathione synthase
LKTPPVSRSKQKFMRILFIADPWRDFKIAKDSTYAMMMEAQARGHEVWFCETADLYVRDTEVRAQVTRLTLRATAEAHMHDWAVPEDGQPVGISTFGAVIMRKDPPFDLEYLYATHLLDRAQAQGAKVFNQGRAIRDHSEKLAILEFPQYTAPTTVTRNEDELRSFLAGHVDVIFKPLDGMGGAGIFRVRADDPNVGSIIETLTDNGASTIMAQRYLPAIKDGDKRVLLIDGVPVAWCLARIPKAGETRGNLAAGGTGVARELTARDREIASALGPTLRARGLLLVGLDIIGEHLTEINVTSPTCFQEITAQSGINVAGIFIDAIERGAAQ